MRTRHNRLRPLDHSSGDETRNREVQSLEDTISPGQQGPGDRCRETTHRGRFREGTLPPSH